MKPENNKSDDNKEKNKEEKEINIYGTVIKTKVYFDSESFFADLVTNIKKSQQLKPTVTPEKKKLENKITELQQKQKKEKDETTKQKDEKRRLAEIILEKSGRVKDNEKKQSMKNQAQNIKNAAENMPVQEDMITADIQYCKGGIVFLDGVEKEIDGNIIQMNNILKSGTPQSYSVVVGFSVGALPSERGDKGKNEYLNTAPNDKDKDKNNKNNNNKNKNDDKDKDKNDKQPSQNVSDKGKNISQQTDQNPLNSDTTKQKKEQSAPNGQPIADNTGQQTNNLSEPNMASAITKLRFSPTIEQKPVNKTNLPQNTNNDDYSRS